MFLAAALLATALTVEDYATMPTLSATRFSPDGKRIAYVLTRADMARSAYDSDVWLAAADGSSDIQLTRGSGSDYQPRWSPDGQSIAFLSDRDGTTAVWLIASGGGEALKLADTRGPARTFEWSPDGKSIAVIAGEPPPADEERRVKDKEDVHVVGERQRLNHLFVADVASHQLRRMTRGKFSVNGLSWSPDGKTIAIERLPGTGLDDLYRSDIYTLSASTSCDDNSCPTLTPLVVRPGADRAPRFSPDGRTIAFTSGGGTSDWLQELQLWTVRVADRKMRLLSAQYDRSPEDFQWSDDSTALYFDGPFNSTSQLFSVAADGSGFRDLSHVEGVLSDADVRAGRAAFVLQALNAPPEIFVADTARFVPRQITHHNDAFRNRDLAETRLIRWTNPKDGLTIEGLLTLPAGYSKGTRVPLLTFVHGGPASRFDQSFLGYLGTLYAPQVLAQHGFAILRPNPRGTGGYGQTFREANRNDWGGMDWIDINAGIDKLIADGMADPDRLGMMGWSYGGFMTSWAEGHSERLKAISIGAPVVDLLSFHGTTDIRDFIPSYFPAAPDAKAPPVGIAGDGTGDAATLEEMRRVPLGLDILRERSPIWHLKRTSARVLIQHGEADDRVPISQGTMLYRMLNELGVDVTMVTYPRSPHVPREPKQRIDAARRNVEFFSRAIPVR